MKSPLILVGGGFGIVLGLIAVWWFLLRSEKREATPDLGIDLELVWIERGEFDTGTDQPEHPREENEKPRRRIRIERGFFLGSYEVTQRQWKAVMDSTPSHFEGDNLPVENVSWDDASEFCKRLSKRTGRRVRLPTEWEWEYACRAGSSTRYSTGDQLTLAQANYRNEQADEPGSTTTVGRYPANAWGLHDMHGNVWEWCQDEYANKAKEAGLRVVRGGAWFFDVEDCRSGRRDGYLANVRADFVGFRVVAESQRR